MAKLERVKARKRLQRQQGPKPPPAPTALIAVNEVSAEVAVVVVAVIVAARLMFRPERLRSLRRFIRHRLRQALPPLRAQTWRRPSPKTTCRCRSRAIAGITKHWMLNVRAFRQRPFRRPSMWRALSGARRISLRLAPKLRRDRCRRLR